LILHFLVKSFFVTTQAFPRRMHHVIFVIVSQTKEIIYDPNRVNKKGCRSGIPWYMKTE